MNEKKDQLIQELEKERDYNYKMYRRYSVVQWCVMIPVVVAGVLTTASGMAGSREIWFAQSTSLVILGLVTAVGSAVNQAGNPKLKSERHFRVKIAMKGILGAIRYQALPIEEAERLTILARRDPEAAVEQLTQRQMPAEN